MAAVPLSQARDPLTLAIDIGSRGSRARVYDAGGAPVRGLKHRVAHQFLTRPDGSSELDPDATLAEVVELITALTERLSADDRAHAARRIGAVAMDTFASSLVGVDADGTALTPCFTYADSRPAARVAELRAELDEAAVQERTGCRFHTGYLPARLRWLKESSPDVFARTARWLSLGEYIFARLLGRYAVSFSTAAWTGLLDRRAGVWDADLIRACGANPAGFSPLHDATSPLTDIGADVAARWPALAGASWFPAIADGYASNAGSGAVDATVVALSAATGGAMRVLVEGVPERVPSGLWCYRVDERRSLLGGALNDSGRVLTWLRDRLQLPDDAALEVALRAPPAGSLPVVLPFLTGERSPGWAVAARAAFAGVTESTTALDLFLGAMAGVALRYGRIAAQLDEVAPAARRVVASGNITETLPGWLQMAADVLGRPVTRVATKQPTLRGTALIALETLAPDVARAPAEMGETYNPLPEHMAYYRELGDRQEALYRALVSGR